MYSVMSVPSGGSRRNIRGVPCATTDEALRQLKARFAKLYANIGRPSISPEKLLRAKSVEP
jgi:hypothetical protein